MRGARCVPRSPALPDFEEVEYFYCKFQRKSVADSFESVNI